jgi:PAS domain S-box-containing protein
MTTHHRPHLDHLVRQPHPGPLDAFFAPDATPEAALRLITERILLSALREQDAAAAAEAARERAQFLTDASFQLGQSLDLEHTYAAIAGLAPPGLDALCIVDVVEMGGGLRRIAVLHPDEDRQAAALVTATRDLDTLRIVGQLGFGNTHVVPIVAHDVLLGAITYAHRPAAATYTSQDIAMAEALAARCAQAIEGAQLYTAARASWADAESARAQAESQQQARITEGAFFRSLTEQSLEFVSILNANAVFTYASPSAHRTVGYPADELLGTSPLDLVHPEDRALMFDTLAALVDGGPGTVGQMTVRLRHKNGSWRYLEGDVQNLLHEPAVRGITSNARDVTARIELEAQRRQAQKMEAVGLLAGGVAHDFNNLLTVIGAHSSFLIESLDSGDPRREDAEAIQSAGVRAAGLTRQLLAFSRKQLLKPAVINLNVIVEGTRSLLERLLGDDIEIVITLASDLRSVLADSSQLDQVLVNLAVNARDAMPQGGRLSIETGMVAITVHSPRGPEPIPIGEYVALTVRDTGIGLDAAVLAHLFEPFFTTKERGKGTGLGLAMVHGIVKQSGGYVLVESAPGKGATFQVYLPALASAVDHPPLARETPIAVRAAETILLVEDEPAIREVAKRILSKQGYVVLEAENGHAALVVSAAFESTIHLVVSDAVMPGMSGGEAVRRLKTQRPNLKILIMSGYTDDEIVRRGIISASVAFLQKPFTAQEFTQAVRKALS